MHSNVRYYPLSDIVWDTDVGVEATRPSAADKAPELLIASSGRHLVAGAANGTALLHLSLRDIALGKNVIATKADADQDLCEGKANANIASILAVPNGDILCLEEDNCLRLYRLCLEPNREIVFDSQLCDDIMQLYSLPHAITMTERPHRLFPDSPQTGVCLGACAGKTHFSAIILENNSRVFLSKLVILDSFDKPQSVPVIASSVTSTGRLLFGMLRDSSKLMLVETNRPQETDQAQEPNTYNINGIITTDLLAKEEMYDDKASIVLLSLLDDKFVVLGRYTTMGNTVIIIYNIQKENIAFHASIPQYISACYLTPCCPGPSDCFFTLQLQSSQEVMSIPFFYFGYMTADDYTDAFQRIDVAIERLRADTHQSSKEQLVLAEVCRDFIAGIKKLDIYYFELAILVQDDNVLTSLPGARFSSTKYLPEVNRNIFLRPGDVYLTDPIVASFASCADEPFVSGRHFGEPLVKDVVISAGETANWNYPAVASRYRQQIRELFNKKCQTSGLELTISEFRPFCLNKKEQAQQSDKFYTNLAFTHTVGTNQLTAYVCATSNVYLADFLPLCLLQSDTTSIQDGRYCTGFLPANDGDDLQGGDQAVAEDQLPQTEPTPLTVESTSNEVPANKATPSASTGAGANTAQAAFSYFNLDDDLDKKINNEIAKAEEDYITTVAAYLDRFSSNEAHSLVIDTDLPGYFAENPHYLKAMRQLNQLKGIRMLLESRAREGNVLSKRFLSGFYFTKKRNMLPEFGTPLGTDALTFSLATIKSTDGTSYYKFESYTRIEDTTAIDTAGKDALLGFCVAIRDVLYACQQQVEMFKTAVKLRTRAQSAVKLAEGSRLNVSDYPLNNTEFPIASEASKRVGSGSFYMLLGLSGTGKADLNSKHDPLDLSSYEDIPIEEINQSVSRPLRLNSAISSSLTYRSSYFGQGYSQRTDMGSSFVPHRTAVDASLAGDHPKSIANAFKASSIDELLRNMGSQTTMQISLRQKTHLDTQKGSCIPAGTSFIAPQAEANVTSMFRSAVQESMPSKRSTIFDKLASIKPTFKEAPGAEYSDVLSISFHPKATMQPAASISSSMLPDTPATAPSNYERPDDSYIQDLLHRLLPKQILVPALPNANSSSLFITDLRNKHMLETIVKHSSGSMAPGSGPGRGAMQTLIEKAGRTLFGVNNSQNTQDMSSSAPKPTFSFPSSSQVAPAPASNTSFGSFGTQPVFTFDDSTANTSTNTNITSSAFTFPSSFGSAPDKNTERDSSIKAAEKPAVKLDPPQPSETGKKPDSDAIETAQKTPDQTPPATSFSFGAGFKPTGTVIDTKPQEAKTGFSFNVAKPFSATEEKPKTDFNFGFNSATIATAANKTPINPFNTAGNISATQSTTDAAKPAASNTPAPTQPASNLSFGFGEVTINPAPQTQTTVPVTTFQNAFSMPNAFGANTNQAAPSSGMFALPTAAASNTSVQSVFGGQGIPTEASTFGTGKALINFSFGSAGASNK